MVQNSYLLGYFVIRSFEAFRILANNLRHDGLSFLTVMCLRIFWANLNAFFSGNGVYFDRGCGRALP